MTEYPGMNSESDQEPIDDLQRLRAAIGQVVQVQDRACRIMEVLEDGPSVVIECLGMDKTIQANQFGDATRRVAQTRTIPLYDREQRPNPDIELLFEALQEK
ncbi:hypothetical protein D6C00_00460 [Thiohalobacter thiocyanaticus]|uniref:Uncharacterized protein n=2 Tax=Thiohalobacter thiocyanaticus TaxID=585455 RepID=A0A426QFT2_9GAMM|nr:hypothetical protein D6C00_00460 [Thiohalobacter thiocyanaticus]